VWYNYCCCQSEGHLLQHAVTGLTTPDLYEKFKQPNLQSFSTVWSPSSSKPVRRWSCTWCAEANPSAEGLIYVVRHIHMYTEMRRIALGVS
jgi:hypothetical protein